MTFVFSLFRMLSKPRLIKYRFYSNQDKQYTVVYKWPTMRHFRVISRFKTYQSLAMLLSTPLLTYWYYIGSVSSAHVIYGYSAAGGTVFVLCWLSYMFKRILGELAYCHKTHSVRVSHLNFFGLRRDLIVHANDIIPYSDSQSVTSLSFLQKLEIVNLPSEVFYYSLRYGHVVDTKQFRTLIGM